MLVTVNKEIVLIQKVKGQDQLTKMFAAGFMLSHYRRQMFEVLLQ